MYILGLSAFYHDSAAALVYGDDIVAAAQEERFSRKKHDDGMPLNAIAYCLKEANISLNDVSYIAFYDKPFLKFERILETYVAEAPRGFKSFFYSMPKWLKEKIFLKDIIAKELVKFCDKEGDKKFFESIRKKLRFLEHHQSHASSAFYPSPFNDAAVLTIDGVGEWATTSICHGQKNNLKALKEIHFPHSLGLLYSAFTYYTGFKVNSGEYKLMGLAPYGNPIYVDTIKKNLIDIKADGSFRLDMSYFGYTTDLTMTSEKFHKLFGGAPREREGLVTQREMDLAASIQKVCEEIMVKLARHAQKVTGSKNLCLSGGVALNCVGNGVVLREKIFKNIWIQPASGDGGSALGAALYIYYNDLKKERVADGQTDKMKGSYLGPRFSNEEVKRELDRENAKYDFFENETLLLEKVAELLAAGKVVGWHQGRMEFGPRALGSRSILGDAGNVEMQTTMNLKIKYRESFRPFAPAVLREDVSEWFEMDCESPYMLLVAPVAKAKQIAVEKTDENLFGIDKLKACRSMIPAVTHVDMSARVQTVDQVTHPRYYKLIKEFKKKTNRGVIVNTSFNVRGEPIVCTPKESFRCFMRTEMDVLVVENFLMLKGSQGKFHETSDWKKEFELD